MANTDNTQKPTAPENTNPIKRVIDVMRKVDTKGPEAKQNEVSIKDRDGKRINLNDEDVEFNYYKGIFERKSDKK